MTRAALSSLAGWRIIIGRAAAVLGLGLAFAVLIYGTVGHGTLAALVGALR